MHQFGQYLPDAKSAKRNVHRFTSKNSDISAVGYLHFISGYLDRESFDRAVTRLRRLRTVKLRSSNFMLPTRKAAALIVVTSIRSSCVGVVLVVVVAVASSDDGSGGLLVVVFWRIRYDDKSACFK